MPLAGGIMIRGSRLLVFLLFGWAWLASGCADLNYAIHRSQTGLDCRPEVIRQHQGQCAPVKRGGAS